MERQGRDLLWIDDDGPGRFLYEEFMLIQSGWRIAWATSVREALAALGGQGFDAVLLDQMLPLDPGLLSPTDVWSGCLLLYWLRGKERPSAAPQAEEPDIFEEISPLEANRSSPVVIVSAFHDDKVEEAIRSAEPSIRRVRKPIEFEKLITKLLPGDGNV